MSPKLAKSRQEAKVTKAALSSRSWWVAGCRPAMIWAGFAVIMLNYVIEPYILVPLGAMDLGSLEQIRLDANGIWPIIGGTGIVATLRAVDKAKGSTHLQSPTLKT